MKCSESYEYIKNNLFVSFEEWNQLKNNENVNYKCYSCTNICTFTKRQIFDSVNYRFKKKEDRLDKNLICANCKKSKKIVQKNNFTKSVPRASKNLMYKNIKNCNITKEEWVSASPISIFKIDCPTCFKSFTRSKQHLISLIHSKMKKLNVSQDFQNYLFDIYCSSKCSRKSDFIKKDLNAIFIEKAIKVHGDRYDYSQVNYVTAAKHKVKVICKIHGGFYTRPSLHLQGFNCPACKKVIGVWKKSEWTQKGKSSTNFEAYRVYILRFYNENEEFIKIGKTFLPIGKRFKTVKNFYNIEVINLIETKNEKDAGDIYDLETILHRKFVNYRYSPLIDFGGKTECFSTKILKYLTEEFFVKLNEQNKFLIT